MEAFLGKTGQITGLMALLLVALAGCQPSSAPDPAQAAAQEQKSLAARVAARLEARAAAKAAQAAPDPVAVVEDTALPVWNAPELSLAPEQLAQARKDADKALAEDRLYKDASDAIPLYLAILAQDPQNRAAQQGLDKARQRLRSLIGQRLAQTENQRVALAEAAEMRFLGAGESGSGHVGRAAWAAEPGEGKRG